MTIAGKWAKVLAVAAVMSIGLNLFLIGFLIAGGGHGPHGGRFGWGGQFMGGHRSALHEAIQGEMSAKGFDRRQMRDEMRDAAQRIAELLRADTVDRAQLEMAMAPMVEKLKGAIDAAHDAMLDVAMKLPADKRKELAEEMLSHRRWQD
jgi:uncharacterized membrane protein